MKYMYSVSSRPASFWMTNPLVNFTNNVAAGGEGTGIWFIFPDEPLPPSRQFNLMQKDEAKNTMILDFYNNVGHSQGVVGISGKIQICSKIWITHQ